ncbi:hypothetical protein ZEAMMB73_Zm00001d048064 [Zea mays]|uniref:Uncharacterized protein n=1 Tax=Zea mays TaxID=4577 RepID=A0A1D6PGU0_MAIZE|nr:hypothetical protein ZEAMMB73_Zm00001d048064 [Zea mays]
MGALRQRRTPTSAQGSRTRAIGAMEVELEDDSDLGELQGETGSRSRGTEEQGLATMGKSFGRRETTEQRASRAGIRRVRMEEFERADWGQGERRAEEGDGCAGEARAKEAPPASREDAEQRSTDSTKTQRQRRGAVAMEEPGGAYDGWNQRISRQRR